MESYGSPLLLLVPNDKKNKHHNTQNTQAANVNTFHTKTGLNNLHRRAALLKAVVSRISIVCALQV